MTTPTGSGTRRRRRGTELETAILEAAWDELSTLGFPRLTMESVATRAGTGIAVLYRRWPNKDELVLNALEHHRNSRPVELADSGTLRGDLLEALLGMGQTRAAFFLTVAATTFSGLMATSGLSPAAVRESIIGDRGRTRARILYQRAHDRGEIDLTRTRPDVLAMPFDLVRHDLLMNLEPVSTERIHTIVDGLFLPLITT